MPGGLHIVHITDLEVASGVAKKQDATKMKMKTKILANIKNKESLTSKSYQIGIEEAPVPEVIR